MRTHLVTGGAGFIGSHLVEHLLARGDRVIVVDDLSTGRRENLASCEHAVRDGRLTVIRRRVLDLMGGRADPPQSNADRDQTGSAGTDAGELEPVDAIYHLAAAVGVRLVVEQPIHTIETNVLETSAILRFAQRAGADGGGVPTFIASTSEVYGKGVRRPEEGTEAGAADAAVRPMAEDDDVVYGATVHSRWSYACSKAIDEFLALAYAREHALPVVIGRLFNTVGPRQRGDYGMVLPRFVAAAAAGEPIEVHGDGQQSRCFCDVRDVVPAIVTLVDRAGDQAKAAAVGADAAADDAPAPIYNIGSDRLMTIQELAELVRSVLSSASPIVHVPYDTVFGPGFDDMRSRRPDLKRIRQAIQFEPSVPLEQTIRDIAARFAENPEARSRVFDSMSR